MGTAEGEQFCKGEEAEGVVYGSLTFRLLGDIQALKYIRCLDTEAGGTREGSRAETQILESTGHRWELGPEERRSFSMQNRERRHYRQNPAH